MAFEAHQIECQASAVESPTSGASDRAPARLGAADPWATILIRGALAAVILYSAAHLLIGALAFGNSFRLFTPHAAVIVLAAAAIGLTWTSLYRNHWREIVLMEASTLTIGAMGLSSVGAPSGDFFIQAMMLQVGTAAVVPWGIKWQAVYAAVCLAAASLTPANDPFVVYRWLELGAASGLALFISELLERYREQTRRRISVLQASEEQLWKIFDANPDIVTIASYPEGRHLDVSNNFLKTGFTKEEAIGATGRELQLWADESRLALYEETLKSVGHVNNMEAAFRLRNGTLVPCLISGTVVRLSRGRCVVSVVRDISRIKRAEQELIAARTAAETASRAKSEFLSSMSHEIRTPMNAILGIAEVLADSDLDADQRKYLSIMINNGNALLDLINDILDLARVESGKLSLERADFDLHDLAERVAETLSIRAHQKKLELVVRIAPEIPARVIGDPLRLRQVLVNLIGNAIKFTERGEIVLSIEPQSAADPALLHFTVTDTGIGIRPENIDGIFASYAQADQSTARKYGGAGLGLAIVKRLVELMGGRIWVESEIGAGSKFHFTARFGLQPPLAANEESSNLENARVLIVDDSPAARRAFHDLLANRCAEVVEADSCEKALALLGANADDIRFSAVLLDCGMDETNGCGVALQMRAAQPDGGVVIPMLTTEDLTTKLPALRRAGFLNHLIKPIRRAELFAAIENAIGSSMIPAPADSRRKMAPIAVAERAESAPHRTAPAPAEPAASASDRPLHILLADDSPDNQLLIEAFVRKVGWTLDKADDGEVAVRKFVASHYDVVLMDIQMPVMDGYAAARRIREWENDNNAPRTPIIALTASVLDEAVGKSFEAGCDTHVSKPVRRPTLIAAIRAVTAVPADNIGATSAPMAASLRRRRELARGAAEPVSTDSPPAQSVAD